MEKKKIGACTYNIGKENVGIGTNRDRNRGNLVWIMV